MMETLVSIFEERVKLAPHAIAITFGDQHWTYSELNHYANFVANLLRKEGVSAKSIIGVTGEKSFEMIAGILAILKLNCSYMPLDTSLPFERIGYMLSNASVKYVVSNQPADYYYDDVKHIVLNAAESQLNHNDPNLNEEIVANDSAYIMHTSGTTGLPKAVNLPHRALIRLLINTNYIQIMPKDVVLFHSNTSFDAGIFEVWSALLNGARLVISPHMLGDIPAIFKLCKSNDVTILLLATGLFHIFSNLNVNELPHLSYLVVGGDVMHPNAAKRVLQNNPNLTVINGYGPTENCVFTTCHIIKDESDVGNPVSIGKPITGTDVFILDNALAEVPQGASGELFTSGVGLALGYLNAPDLTADKFIRLPIANNALLYRTGDIVKKLSNGDFQFIGRNDHQVKIRGYRVEIKEVELIISELPFVEDVCICTSNDEIKKLIAFVKCHDKKSINANEYDIKKYIQTKLPSYCVPSLIKISDQFPLTPNGKIDRTILQRSINIPNPVHA